jgi:hypothetical protein
MMEVTGRWRKLHEEELHNIYAATSIILRTNSRRTRWMGHMARMLKMRNTCSLGRKPLKDKIICKTKPQMGV